MTLTPWMMCSRIDSNLHLVFHGWLGSLWTLQEACIGPDMWLCNWNWEVLSLVDGQSLQLDGLIALANQASSPRYVDGPHGPTSSLTEYLIRAEAPNIVRDVDFTLNVTSMISILQFSLNDILWLGDRRYCQDRRAEGVMSIIGVTQWYRDAKARDDGLILGRYPLEFVENTR